MKRSRAGDNPEAVLLGLLLCLISLASLLFFVVRGLITPQNMRDGTGMTCLKGHIVLGICLWAGAAAALAGIIYSLFAGRQPDRLLRNVCAGTVIWLICTACSAVWFARLVINDMPYSVTGCPVCNPAPR